MSHNDHPTTAANGHTDDGAVHAHVSHWLLYIVIFGALLFLTALTVGQSYVDLGSLNLLAVILIASTKATLVLVFFMHLAHDNKFHGLALVCSLLFIGVFFAYTMNDTEHRGELDPTASMPIRPETGEQAPGGFDAKEADERRAKMVKEHGHGGSAAPHTTAPAAPNTSPAMPEHH